MKTEGYEQYKGYKIYSKELSEEKPTRPYWGEARAFLDGEMVYHRKSVNGRLGAVKLIKWDIDVELANSRSGKLFLNKLADLCEQFDARLFYTTDDDGINITVGGELVFADLIEGTKHLREKAEEL